MKINHHAIHYIVGVSALALGIHAFATPPVALVSATGFGASAYGTPALKTSRFEWPALGQDKTTSLGEAIKKLPEQKVMLFCSTISCQGLRTDIDDALQIAGWASDFEDRFVDSEADHGIFVGPPGEAAAKFAHELALVTGVDVKTVNITKEDGSPIDGLGVIIGKSEGN